MGLKPFRDPHILEKKVYQDNRNEKEKRKRTGGRPANPWTARARESLLTVMQVGEKLSTGEMRKRLAATNTYSVFFAKRMQEILKGLVKEGIVVHVGFVRDYVKSEFCRTRHSQKMSVYERLK